VSTARHRRRPTGRLALGTALPTGRLALGTALAALVVCAGGASAAVFGLAGVTAARAGGTYIPPTIRTALPRLGGDAGAGPLPRSVPREIKIPGIGVDAPVVQVGRDADGSVQVPPLGARNLTGWYRYGPAPGQRGPAVILGHVDSATGASVFYRLRDLRAGDRVYVTLADGTVAAFVVDGLQKVAKDAFPTASVYGKAGYPSLRLITCGGPFDRATGHYLDNIIVYAHLIA
jgi:LPXTG-site transpeptidase (sortase) family protein